MKNLKTVLIVDLKIHFTENPTKKYTIMPFASVNGINGNLILDNIDLDGKIMECQVTMETDHKKMFDLYEFYLEAIKTTIGHHYQNSVIKLSDMVVLLIRTPDLLNQIKTIGPYSLAMDQDNEVYLLNNRQDIIKCFSSEGDAIDYLNGVR